jgi:hypothetical protein
MEDKSMTISEIHEKLDVLGATDQDRYNLFLFKLSKEQLIELDKFQRNERMIDPNFSFGAERVTIILAGKTPHDIKDKHGIDSDDNAEAKPEKVQKTKKKRLTGDVSFADMSLNKIEELTNKNTEILSSGFVGNKCLYVIGIPMDNNLIKKRLTEQYYSKLSKNQRRVLGFSRTQYGNSDNNKLYYISPNFEDYKNYITKPQYDFIMNLHNSSK